MISKLLKLLLLLLLTCLTIRYYGQSDSSRICLTIPQFRYYANALVERAYLQSDTSDCRVKENAYLQAIKEKDIQLRMDTLALEQKELALDKQQKAYGDLASDFRKVEKARNGWRGFGIGAGFAAILTGVVSVLTKR